MSDAAPDLFRLVAGFRQFRVHGSELRSLHTDDVWTVGPHTARCLRHPEHDGTVPVHDCACGFYAWYGPPPRGASAVTADLVAGAVVLWGRMELHPNGMRAEHAMVAALALPFSRGAKRSCVQAAARALGVPAVPARRLKAAVLEHGDLIPHYLRPRSTTPNKRAAPGPPAPARLAAVADGYRSRTRG
jgi:hypothetical protein